MTRQQKEFKGYHLAIIMVCFFGVIVTVNFTMAFIANTHWTGLVVKNSYVASQKFNGELQAAEKQKEKGWRSTVQYENGMFELQIVDRAGKPLQPRFVTAEVGRPAFEQRDHELTFRPIGNGLFISQDQLAPGLWKVTINAEIHDQPYKRDLRLNVSSDGKGRIL